MIRLKRDKQYKQCPTGFSWTNLFFGFLVPLFRKDWKQVFIQLLLGILTSGLSVLVFPFFYNKWYLDELLEEGFEPAGEYDKDYLIYHGYVCD